ncbi:MAG: CDP-6-deoxy-delta-3,4-glucoseen reductase [Rhodoferax sp.]|nr:CDP-6-deoxy-delta-3,4-glucoseen reductase [Rhodoferax sp.]
MTTNGAATSSFSVTVQPSGRTFTVEQGEAILPAGIRQGIGLPYGCKDGACGSCKCKMLSGSVVHGTHQEKALTQDEAAAGMILTCCAVPQTDLLLESRQVSAAGALPIKKMPTRVSSLEKKSADVMVIKLQLPANDTFEYHAGQYIEFLLRDGARRSYSMANAPAEGAQMELHIRHMPGGKFTDLVFGSMKEKDILRIEGPFGSFYLREEATEPMVMLASGTGFAPVKALLERMRQLGSTRNTTLYWGGRRPSDLYMDAWVRDFAQTNPWLSYVPVVSDALPEDGWSGRTGFVHQAVLEDLPDLSAYQVYACGAPIVVDSAKRDFCFLAGLSEDNFFADAFTSEADKAHV